MSTFACLLVNKSAEGAFSIEVTSRSIADLPPGDVTVRVQYSSLNYKDGLSTRGHPGVTRKFPHVPGIDAVGEVVECRTNRWQPGDRVIVTGHDLGMNTWGGFGELIRVPDSWPIRLPTGLSMRDAMIYGTAGLTAAQCVHAIREHGVQPSAGDVVVTGATGGVGSLATAMLAKLGYSVVAVTGKSTEHDFLCTLGAARIVERGEVNDTSGKPLLGERWSAAVDTVGGNTLATIVRSARRGGVVTACGMVGGVDLPLTVYPFILRNVSLAGIDSVECPDVLREQLWSKLADEWRPAALASIATEVSLTELPAQIERILNGAQRGRVIVRHGTPRE
ncbi:MAG: YhdH/YhfP family quinone oxidoreductase [Planctomycetaceae bacterium]|nr:YhdH/YhfP family quinone oxidoreductase [Planctomycetaceae bacterium]